MALGTYLNLHLYIEPGLHAVLTSLVAVAVLAVVNALIRPIVTLFTLPISCLTLGLFSFVINAFMFWIVGPGRPGLPCPRNCFSSLWICLYEHPWRSHQLRSGRRCRSKGEGVALELTILSGMSGAGKATAGRALEEAGQGSQSSITSHRRCCPALVQSSATAGKLCAVIDARSGSGLEELSNAVTEDRGDRYQALNRLSRRYKCSSCAAI